MNEILSNDLKAFSKAYDELGNIQLRILKEVKKSLNEIERKVIDVRVESTLAVGTDADEHRGGIEVRALDVDINRPVSIKSLNDIRQKLGVIDIEVRTTWINGKQADEESALVWEFDILLPLIPPF